MPSFSSDDPIDVVHLQQMTLGDAALELEILTMFGGQAVELIASLRALPPDAGDFVHKLKGSGAHGH